MKLSLVERETILLYNQAEPMGGLPRKNSRPRLWCLHCLTMAVSV